MVLLLRAKRLLRIRLWQFSSLKIVGDVSFCMSFSRKQVTKPVARRVGTRVRQPNRSLDFEASNLETLCLRKNSRSGHLSTVTVISNKISGLLTDDHNLQEVKEKLP